MDTKKTWRAPSNIALIKYWGKNLNGEQFPLNPSISFTLKNCYTETTIELTDIGSDHLEVNSFLDQERNLSFDAKGEKLKKYFEKEFPQLKNKKIILRTHNTFPHSSGIASSASGMAALSLSLLNCFKNEKDLDFFSKASFFSRLGSGSAGRSVYPGLVSWGMCTLDGSSDEVAKPLETFHAVFKDYQDSILIVSRAEKSVSSSAGHKLMVDHPYAKNRVENANKNFNLLLEVLHSGDLSEFIRIVESEALELHSLMMTSNPSFILIVPQTLSIVQEIRKFRNETKIPVCFTIDAGPNVHILYPKQFKSQVHEFIEKRLNNFYLDIIHDEVGDGPQKIS
jgi:diphosphomevalonate decarboxylase